MQTNNIKPDKITKPIQLLAVWLLGLILLVSALLTASINIYDENGWIAEFFAISAVSIIPMFLVLIFLLQTKFRPEMQEDEFYSKYLNSNTLEKTSEFEEKLEAILDERLEKYIEILNNSTKKKTDEKLNKRVLKHSIIDDLKNKVYLNTKLEKFNEINSFLQKNKIEVDKFFGTEKLKQPEIFLFSFGPSVKLDYLKLLIPELVKYGLTHIRTSDGSISKNGIYIGSYAYREIEGQKPKKAAITPNLVDQIKNAKSTAEAYSIVEANMK